MMIKICKRRKGNGEGGKGREENKEKTSKCHM